jgi:guanylate kinase
MLSDQTTEQLNKLFQDQDQYEPNMAVADKLATKTIVMLIGATCEGKNAVMDAASKLDEQFKVAGTRTSREPREGDDTKRYTYFENSDAGLAKVFQDIENREMVQYAVNPYAQLIYGSTIKDYSGTYNLADVFSSAVDNFRRLGFQQALAITVVSQPDVWLKRFEERFPAGSPQRRARRDEAIESFTWSLSQNDTDHFWIENIDGKVDIAAQEVINISMGTSKGQPAARNLAEASLEAAWSIQV